MALAQDLINRALLRLAEAIPATPKHWTRAEVLYWINDAVTELNLIAGNLTKSVDVTWSRTNNVLDLPADTISPIELYFNSEVIKKYSVEGLDSKLRWDDSSVALKPKAWCPIGTTKILVYPMAQKADQTVQIVAMYQPAAVAEAGALEVPAQYVDAIEHYIFARARFKEGGAEFAQGEIDYDRFFKMADELKIRTQNQRRTGWRNRIELKGSLVGLKD